MNRTKYLLVTASVLLACFSCLAQGAGPERPVTVFENGQDGYKIFRIPAIVRAANGQLLAFCEARQGGDLSEIDLVLRRSSDNGRTWQALEVVQQSDDFRDLFPSPDAQISVGNAAPVVDLLDPQNAGRIWLPFTVENDRVFVTYSDDHGKTWAARRELTSQIKRDNWGWYATGPVHSIQLQHGKQRGRLVVPCDHRIGRGGHDAGALGAHVVYSDDHGKSWQLGAVDDSYDDGVNANETTVAELADGRLYFNTRDHGGAAPGTRGGVFSADGGESFTPPNDKRYKTFAPTFADPEASNVLDTPVVQAALLQWNADQNEAGLLLFSGPDESGPSGKGRSDLRIRYSTDAAKSWHDGPMIHVGPAAYSDMVQVSAEQLGVLFEAGDAGARGYTKIVFVPVNIETIAAEQAGAGQ